ncbi:phosphotransferase [uncultured Bradyrhizobium sp.]|uniref:phosphotransferase n=1 Tax=uncultured Bradyrhizobium sp. TaxID=199684 RepID=UPI00260EAB3C|nr:phosphotransferase [uncultured Bradyrhizobium sp.]
MADSVAQQVAVGEALKLPRIDAPRTAVLCIGAPSNLAAELEALSLKPIQLDAKDLEVLRAQIEGHAAGSRAVMIFSGPLINDLPTQQLLRKIINAVKISAEKQALLIAVIVEGSADDLAKGMDILGPSYFGSSAYASDKAQIGLAVKGVLQHDPGPAWRDLEIGTDVNIEDRALIQRAFSDCESLSVCKIARDKDDPTKPRKNTVYRVDAVKPTAPHPVPYLVKVDTAQRVTSERANIAELCSDTIPFPFVPPMIPVRYAPGTERSALVLHFVDRAMLLSEYAKSHNLNRAVLSIFDDALRVWRSHPTTKSYALGNYVLDTARIIRSAPQDYGAAHANLPDAASVPRPEVLLEKLRNMPPVPVNEVCSHGDLHLRNIFVRQSGEVVLIDFLRSGIAPASRDPAELECSIAFDPDAGRRLDNRLLHELYSPPLLLPKMMPRPGNGRFDAVCQVRMQMGAIVGEIEYQLMVAAHLLWWARKKNPEAYRLAAGLILSAEAGLCAS